MVGVWNWFSFWLILHILAVIIGLGASFAIPVLGAYAGSHPEASLAIAEAGHQLETRVVIPVATVIPLFGTALIYTGHYDLWKSTWLLVAIGLFIVTYFFAVTVQDPNSRRLIAAIKAMPPGPPPPEATGPPPEIAAITQRLRVGGMFLSLMVVVIVVLMIWRPGCQLTGGGPC
jgi:Predicted integral membrane protein (DUF2269)